MSNYNFENIENLLQKTYKQALRDVFNSKECEMNGVMIKNLDYFENQLCKLGQKNIINKPLFPKQNEELNSPMKKDKEKIANISRKELFFSGLQSFEKNENSFIKPNNKENLSGFLSKNKDEFQLQMPLHKKPSLEKNNS